VTQIPQAGLLILGRERALKANLSTHEVAFQVLDGTNVRVNNFMRWPLLKAFQYMDEQFALRTMGSPSAIPAAFLTWIAAQASSFRAGSSRAFLLANGFRFAIFSPC
jgi:hypothetical protein